MRTSHVSSAAQPVTPEGQFEFTPSHVARATSQAIRSAIREGNVSNACFAVHSMLHSPLDSRIDSELASRILLPAMKLGRRLPSRLVAHSLVHGLVREGLILEAGWELQRLISVGIRFHIRTLEVNVGLLCSAPPQSPRGDSNVEELPTADPPPSWGDSDAGFILGSLSTRLRPETHLALNILDTARKSRHRRTEGMYSRLVDACLLQGEIIVATLLFVLLVKDWQLRKAVRPSLSRPENTDEDTSLSVKRTKGHLFKHNPATLMHVRRVGYQTGTPRIPFPEKTILQKILNSINGHILSRDPCGIARGQSIESLSILADLLRQRSIPFGQISPLLRTLQNCPSSPDCNTGILWNGYFVDVNVYDQVHEVLHEYCVQPSASGPASPSENPPLDLRTYNCLLYYALRHRLSPALANSIIEHMTVHRMPPLQPDSVTYNTLLRSSSLLSRNDIAREVLEKFRQRMENSDHAVSRMASDISHLIVQRKIERDKSRSPLYERIQAEKFTVPNFVESPNRPHLRADLYTLSSYITHLVSIGKAHLVADMIFQLLPELQVIDHPAGNLSLDETWTHKLRVKRRKECIARAVEYGPFVFSALLNALRKAGKTGLAERVWLLARQAERASWIPRNSPGSHPPWCLPIHAYTSMMQCYANESRKGFVCIRGTRYSTSLSPSLYSMQRELPWAPQRNQSGKIYARGWAYFFLKMQAKEQGFHNSGLALRAEAGRAVGLMLYKAMRSGAMSVWQELMLVQPDRVRLIPPQWATQLESLELPVPDARFFNAVLDIFGRYPGMQARRTRSGLSWWRRRLRNARRRFASTGLLRSTYDQTLIQIAKEMAQEGYSLPIGLQRALVGRGMFRVRTTTSQTHEIRPWAFPPHRKPHLRPFALSVTKTRGLPLGRRYQKWFSETSPRATRRRNKPTRDI